MRVDVKLSDNYLLSDLVYSDQAIRHKLDEQFIVPHFVVHQLNYLAEYMLEILLSKYSHFRISSGYRCPVLNKFVNGSQNSQHILGQAVDLVVDEPYMRVDGYNTLWDIVRGMDIDQAILHNDHLHVSWKFSGRRNQFIDKRVDRVNQKLM